MLLVVSGTGTAPGCGGGGDAEADVTVRDSGGGMVVVGSSGISGVGASRTVMLVGLAVA